jgi:hypothetical protein
MNSVNLGKHKPGDDLSEEKPMKISAKKMKKCGKLTIIMYSKKHFV